ncbi:MAG: hypothetical protein U1C46_02210 [Bacteroidales bacterium]|nr:hypothetical protein [Bacteroidales bacterium]MDZ4203609.1 hypothetical protein [Bacteroidales bacterium]
MKKVFLAILTCVMAVICAACNKVSQKNKTETDQVLKSELVISEQEVLEAQKTWGEGIVYIGKVYSEGGDYKTATINHIDELYGYNLGTVLFKPTLASEKQFRTNKEGAISYFVSDNPDYPEDHGFAIKPWKAVRWESTGIKTKGNMAVAMGNYFFTPADGSGEVKVEYNFAYTKDDDGKLRIILHGSHLPYSPKH